MFNQPETTNFVCPLPLRRYPQIVMGHGSGGQMMHDLIQHLFGPAFGTEAATDAAVIVGANGRWAFSTDSFVISPLLFPGGDIGSLAVHGTVNDLAVMGAKPLYLSVGFVLEEGLAMETLGHIVYSMAQAAQAAGVQIITGDTKVVEQGHGDGVYINTSGIGLIPNGVSIAPQRASVGDVLLVNGTVGDHGMAVMSQRTGLAFETAVVSDAASLHGLVAAILAVCADVHVLRDLTRGGLAAAAHEIAQTAGVGMMIEEKRVPVQTAVAAACEILGLDPLHVANEGKLLAVVPPETADVVLQAMRQHPLGQQAAIIGTVTAAYPGTVIGRTAIGGQRVIDLPVGELLPRIC